MDRCTQRVCFFLALLIFWFFLKFCCAVCRERVDEEQDWNLLQDSVNVFVQMGYSYNEKKLTIYQAELEK